MISCAPQLIAQDASYSLTYDLRSEDPVIIRSARRDTSSRPVRNEIDFRKHNISISTGRYPYSELRETYDKVFIYMIFEIINKEPFSDITHTGPFVLRYDYRYSPGGMVGLTFIHHHMKTTFLNTDSNILFENVYYSTLMANFTTIFLRSKYFNTYSGIHPGMTYRVGKWSYREDSEQEAKLRDGKYKFAGHVTLLGVSVGNRIQVFGEAGFGYMGMFQYGIKTNF